MARREARLAATACRTFPASDAVDGRPLVNYVRLNLLAVLVAIAWLVVVRLWIVPNGWLDVIVGLLAGLAVSLLCADHLLRRHLRVSAIVTVAVANWVTVITVASMVPFALTIVPICVLLPVLLAVPYLRRFQLNALLGAAIGAIAATAAGGRFTDGVGLEAGAPGWLLDAMTVAFVPLSAGLALCTAWQSHMTLAARAAALRKSRARLVTAADRERHRIEQSLQENTRRRVRTAGTHLHNARRRLAAGEQAQHDLDQMIKELQEASRELRELGHGVFPPELAARGLPAALRTAAQQAPMRVTLLPSTIGRYAPEVEASVYFCCVQTLAIANRCSAGTAAVTIGLADDDGDLSFDVNGISSRRDPASFQSTDDLTSVEDRLGAVGGTLTVSALADGEIRVNGRIPLPFPSRPGQDGWRRWWDMSCRLLGAIWKVASRPYGRLPAVASDGAFAAAGIASIAISLFWAAVVSVVAYAIAPHPWIVVIATTDLTLAVALGWAGRKTRAGLVKNALLATMVTIWIYAVVFVSLVPAAFQQTPLLILLPVLLVIPHVGRRTFQVVTATTVATALIIATAGRFLPGVGIQENTPGWFADVVMLVIITLTAVLGFFVASLNHAALIHRTNALQDSRARLVAAVNQERRHIERDLHDGAQQHLIAAAIEARVTRQLLGGSTPRARTMLAQLTKTLRETDANLRDLASGIYPPELVDRGLNRRCVPLLAPHGRPRKRPRSLQSGTEVNVYFCCVEALQNAVKHAGTDATVAISLRRRRSLEFEVCDTGQGCDPAVIRSGQGYANMHDRLTAIGGTLMIWARPGLGVQVHGRIPT